MTKIVKSSAVVADSDESRAPPPSFQEAVKSAGVIKKRYVEHGVPVSSAPRFPAQDSYTAELNRLRLEIKEAKEELRALALEKKELMRPSSSVQIDASSLEAADESASQIILEAEAKASELISDTKAECLRLLEEARNSGYLDGFSKGYDEAVQEFKDENTPRAVAIADILASLSSYYDDMMAEHEDNMVALAMAVARKILTQTLSVDTNAVVDMLSGIVQENSREEYIKITLAPDLFPIRARAGDKVRKLLEELSENVTVQIDRDASPGTAVLETPKGIVDVGIQTQLDNLSRIIKSE